MELYPVIELSPYRLSNVVVASLLLERMQEFVNGRMLCCRQGEVVGLESLVLDGVDI